jgi:general secretion pathway protein F
LSSGAEQASVVDSLEKLGPIYRSRGNFKSEKLKIFLPILLTIAIGGTATLIYGLTLFLPLSSMLSKLTTP